ncbi:MAG: glutamate 5-kinase [Clostridiales bacterium]|nr:glutamate 5-kinase [Clostridiales bacterium]
MRIVIKIGTSTLTYLNGNLNVHLFENLCKVVADIKNAGNEVILVSSGAIALGRSKLGLKERPADIPSKQAAAAVGQCELMCFYDRAFSAYHHTAAQILITAEDFESPDRRANFCNTTERLLSLGALPVINENDTVATAEISVGDNDTLSALTAVNVNADLLVLLSDIDGLYSADPHADKTAKLIPTVEKITPEIEKLAGGSVSGVGTGGMATKIHAAKLCTAAGCDMVIANGANPEILYDIVAGKSVGTHFTGKKQ